MTVEEEGVDEAFGTGDELTVVLATQFMPDPWTPPLQGHLNYPPSLK